MPIKNATVTCLGDSGTGKMVKWDYDSILRGSSSTGSMQSASPTSSTFPSTGQPIIYDIQIFVSVEKSQPLTMVLHI